MVCVVTRFGSPVAIDMIWIDEWVMPAFILVLAGKFENMDDPPSLLLALAFSFAD